MWISYESQMCTKIDINISHMEMNILEYLSRDLSYESEEMFIMCMIGQWKFPLHANHAIMQTYNKTHSGFKVHVKMGYRWVPSHQTKTFTFVPNQCWEVLTCWLKTRVSFQFRIDDENRHENYFGSSRWRRESSDENHLGIKSENQTDSDILKRVWLSW